MCNAQVEIGGIDFVNTADVIVRFADKKNKIDVKGTFVSQTELTYVLFLHACPMVDAMCTAGSR